MKKLFIFFVFLFMTQNILYAKYIDLGTCGKTYKIIEPDFMQELKKAAKEYFSKISTDEIKKQIKKEIYKQSVGISNLPFARKNAKKTYLNSYTFQQDITNPMGRVIVHKGQTIVIKNKTPLYLCFLKGNMPELKNEVMFFDKIIKKVAPNTECTYLVAGVSVFDVSKAIPNHDFYPVREFYEKRFKVKKYPSLVELKGDKINVYEFGIEQFKHKEQK